MGPTIGRIVHYTLTENDAEMIRGQRESSGMFGNPVEAGQVYPAVVVRVFSEGSSSANLSVLLDGRDTYWATSRCEGDGLGFWAWPPRVGS